MGDRPDYLVSFGLVQEGDIANEVEAIAALAALADRQLLYWEILYVAGEEHREAIRAAASRLAAIKSLRIILVRDGINSYRRRAISAAEAIGDVVVLTSFAEMPDADLIAFAGEAMSRGRIVVGRRRRLLQPLSHSLLGLISDYRVDGRTLNTIALPRDPLTSILARPTASIELRFEPKRGIDAYLHRELPRTSRRADSGLRQRFQLLGEIISTSASRFLTAFAVAAGAVALLAASYGVYAVVVILTLDTVQPGWFSTTIALSGSAAFLSLGMSVIALGIGNIVDRLDAGPRREIVDEIGNISFFDRVEDLNVEIGSPSREAGS